jgi:hypothetical protein
MVEPTPRIRQRRPWKLRCELPGTRHVDGPADSWGEIAPLTQSDSECLGHLLTPPTEMKYIIAALYSGYSTTIVDDTGIEQIDAYTAPPTSAVLMIRLQKLDV